MGFSDAPPLNSFFMLIWFLKIIVYSPDVAYIPGSAEKVHANQNRLLQWFHAVGKLPGSQVGLLTRALQVVISPRQSP
jgi:hypothetical protein